MVELETELFFIPYNSRLSQTNQEYTNYHVAYASILTKVYQHLENAYFSFIVIFNLKLISNYQ